MHTLHFQWILWIIPSSIQLKFEFFIWDENGRIREVESIFSETLKQDTLCCFISYICFNFRSFWTGHFMFVSNHLIWSSIREKHSIFYGRITYIHWDLWILWLDLDCGGDKSSEKCKNEINGNTQKYTKMFYNKI